MNVMARLKHPAALIVALVAVVAGTIWLGSGLPFYAQLLAGVLSISLLRGLYRWAEKRFAQQGAQGNTTSAKIAEIMESTRGGLKLALLATPIVALAVTVMLYTVDTLLLDENGNYPTWLLPVCLVIVGVISFGAEPLLAKLHAKRSTTE